MRQVGIMDDRELEELRGTTGGSERCAQRFARDELLGVQALLLYMNAMVFQNRYCARCMSQSKPCYSLDPVIPITAVRKFPALFRGIFYLDLGFSV